MNNSQKIEYENLQEFETVDLNHVSKEIDESKLDLDFECFDLWVVRAEYDFAVGALFRPHSLDRRAAWLHDQF